MSSFNPTGRFSSRVADYVRYRPGYPPKLLAVLERECGLTPETVIADVGSGTGLLSEVLLRYGATVMCVEPNAEMRAAGEQLLAVFPRFRSLPGSAEATGLPAAGVDLIVAGQAFHWFDPQRARQEFARILRPGGWVVLIWNERNDATPFLAAYEDLLCRRAPEYRAVDHRNVDQAAISRFFQHDEWRRERLPNQQILDWEGLAGRVRSSSYVPLPGSAQHDLLFAELRELFEKHHQDGKVPFLYHTLMYFGRLTRSAG